MTPRDSDKVQTREQLSEFLRTLSMEIERDAADARIPLAHYVEAASAWVTDMDGFFENRGQVAPAEPTWSLVASIFAAARVYE